MLRKLVSRRRIYKAVDHVFIARLSVVALVVLGVRALVCIPLVPVGTSIPVQMPFHERHRLIVDELVLERRMYDVGIPHPYGTHIRRDLDRTTWLDEGSECAKEEPHQVLVAPIHDRVPIKKAANGARVREIVVDSTQGSLQPVESRVDRDARAVDAMVDLRVMLLKLLDATSISA